MNRLILAVALVVSPGALLAQSSSSSTARRLSADAQNQIDSHILVARELNLPEQPIRILVAEGEIKGAPEAEIVAASRRTLVDLQSSYEAIVRGGRARPNKEEVMRGAQLLSRGFTTAQLESLTRRTLSGTVTGTVSSSRMGTVARKP
jgi:hypothetical protein